MGPRRSARLRGNTLATEEPKMALPPAPTLLSVREGDEALKVDSQKPNNDAILSTPLNKPARDKLASSSQAKPIAVAKTPTTVGSIRPALEEMHPSKVHQSTAKQPDSGLILGFHKIKRDEKGKVIKESIMNSTPTKIKGSPKSQLGTPSFDFRFSCDESQLSEEARKLMDNVRGDVARIKAQMVLNKSEQARKECEAEQLNKRRKIAFPRGKTGRFSDAHMAEFRKMDSIAGHPSAFRAQPGRFKPLDKSLKRKISKACLDESEKGSPPMRPVSISSNGSSKIPTITTNGAKRVKRSERDDPSTDQPKKSVSSGKDVNQQKRRAIRSSLMTPTKASAARSTIVKQSKTSMIPTLFAPSTSKIPTALKVPQTDFNPKLKADLPSLGNLKSILRRHQPLFSNDPQKIAAGTHVATPGFNPDINLDDLPSISFEQDPLQTPSPKKRVEFTPNTKARSELFRSSPSPHKISTSIMEISTSSNIIYPTLPVTTPPTGKEMKSLSFDRECTPTIRRVRGSVNGSERNPFPDMLAVPHSFIRKRRREDVDDDKDAENISPTDVALAELTGKKVKANDIITFESASPTPLKSHSSASGKGTTTTTKRSGKGVLTLSRLNLLAKPKSRR